MPSNVARLEEFQQQVRAIMPRGLLRGTPPCVGAVRFVDDRRLWLNAIAPGR